MKPQQDSMAACLSNLAWLSLGRLHRYKENFLSMAREALKPLGLQSEPNLEGNFFSGYRAAVTIESAGVAGRLALGQMGFAGTEGAQYEADGLPMELDLFSDYHELYLKERIIYYWKDWSFLAEPSPLTADFEFDRCITVCGDPLRGIALMKSDLRQAALSTVGNGAKLREGRLTMSVNNEMFCDAAELHAWIEPLVSLMRLLVEQCSRETLSCLIDNSRHDPLSEVRAFNILAMNRSFPESPEALDAMRQVMQDDPSLACRVAAAAGLGGEGTPFLVKIVKECSQGPVRAAALFHLGSALPRSEAEQILLSHVIGAEPLMFEAALRGLDTCAGGALALEKLQDLADSTENSYGRQEIRAVTKHIQTRLEQASAGNLSVAAAEGDEGRLSRPEP